MEGDFRIGDWLVQPHLNRILGADQEVRLEPKAMEVLTYLVDNAGEVIPKDQIIREVWNASFVTEEVLTNSIWELRKALGDDAKNPSYIQTVPRRGYRLIASVHRQPDSEETPISNLPPSSGFTDGYPLRSSSAAAGWNTVSFWKAGHTIDETAPRRLPRWLLAIGVTVAAGMVITLSWSLFSGWRPFVPGGQAEVRPSIAIMQFENHIDSEQYGWLSEGVCSMLQSGLAGVPGLDIVSSEKIDEAVRQIAREEKIDQLDASFFPGIARRAGARTFLTGSIVKSGSEIRIDAQLEDVADGSILSAHTVRGTDVLQLVDDLARRMGQGMDLDEPLPRTKVSGVTASLEAYRLYSEGVEALRHLRLSDADRLFLEAVAVDPDFGLAYWELHKVALVRHDKIAAEGYLRRSLANRERLPERQQLLARAGQLVHQDDRDEAVELLEEILGRYPDEEYAYVLLAIVHLASNRTDQGLAVLASGVKAVPDSGLMRSYYGYGMLRSGRYPEAIRQFEDYAQMYPGDVNPYDRLGEAYLIAGMPERALEEYSRAPGTNGSSSTSSFGRSWASAMMGQYAEALEHLDESGDLPADQAPYLVIVRAFLVSRIGRYLEAEQHLQEGIRRARDRQDTLFEARTHILAAMLAVEQGAFADAVRRTDRALALLPNLSGDGRREILMLASLFAGLARARDGRLDAAIGDLDSLRALYDGRDPRENWWYHLLEGEIALAQWDFRTAEIAFSDGEPELKMWFSSSDLFGSIAANLPLRDGSARAKKLKGDLSGAIRIYRKLLTPDITQRWTGVLEPLHVLELARLLAQQGNLVAAGQQYERFVSLWSRANPDSLSLAEAQQFLAE